MIVASDFFNNTQLRENDHGELLLALAALNHASGYVAIVQNLDALPWYRLLWKHYRLALLSLAALLALLFWAAVRRFGPVLPAPANQRRSLMEHIDAAAGHAFNIGGGIGNSLSLLELFKLLEAEISQPLQYTELPPRGSDQRVFVADIGKMNRLTGWQPNVSAKEGVSRMLNWVSGTVIVH